MVKALCALRFWPHWPSIPPCLWPWARGKKWLHGLMASRVATHNCVYVSVSFVFMFVFVSGWACCGNRAPLVAKMCGPRAKSKCMITLPSWFSMYVFYTWHALKALHPLHRPWALCVLMLLSCCNLTVFACVLLSLQKTKATAFLCRNCLPHSVVFNYIAPSLLR